MRQGNTLREKVLKQHRLPAIGAIKELLIYDAFYLSLFNSPMMIITAYNVSRWWIDANAPWMTLKLALIFFVIYFIVVSLIEYKFITPSYFAFRDDMYKKHGESLELVGLKEEVKALGKKIDELLGKKEERDHD